ncbi:MAG: MarR family transcriptional regulator [Pseudonocardiaceae bacterium]|nr:MarR family transcriptional regulator [Pseudonocardiaceae bacterium]
MADEAMPGRDEEAVRRFVENFAVTMSEAGFPRMPARVFVALLVSESGSRTAAELAEFLKVSPAAISGAVRYLMQVSLVGREREPGARRDHYRVVEDWHEVMVRRDQVMQQWTAAMKEGIETVGADSEAGKRMEEMRDLFAFLGKEIPLLYEKWRAGRS